MSPTIYAATNYMSQQYLPAPSGTKKKQRKRRHKKVKENKNKKGIKHRKQYVLPEWQPQQGQGTDSAPQKNWGPKRKPNRCLQSEHQSTASDDEEPEVGEEGTIILRNQRQDEFKWDKEGFDVD
jgi:hypothetical protein